jgi:hypothetical protein
MGAKERLMVVSAGADENETQELARFLLPADARFRSHVGGTFSALNARIASLLLRQYSGRALALSKARELLHDVRSTLTPAESYDRDRQSDEEIRTFIRGKLNNEPETSRTSLLRRLRDTGRACGRSRFERLYREIKEKD